MSTPAFRKGGDAAEEAAKSMGGRFARVNYFSLEENKTTVVRFLTDSPEWIYVKQHPSVPTKNAPADFKGNWPKSMPAVCRHDDAFKGMHDDCYICDAPIMNPRDTTKPLKPALRVWALAVAREAVVEDGITRGYRTVIEELPERNDKGEETGRTIKQPKILVVNMGMKNFFSGLQGLYTAFGTVCDRDYLIRRTGDGLDTDYQIINLDKVPGVEPGTEAWDKFTQAVEDQKIDLGDIITQRASDEYYARFFDPTKTAPSSGGSGGSSSPQTASSAPQGAPAAQQAQAPSNGVVDPDRLAAMRDRVRSTGSASADKPSESPEPAAAAAGGMRSFD